MSRIFPDAMKEKEFQLIIMVQKARIWKCVQSREGKGEERKYTLQ